MGEATFPIVDRLYDELSYPEWKLLEYYVRKAQEYSEVGNDRRAHELLEDAIAVAMEKNQENIVIKIRKYINFF